jgi:hypothetical protein
MFIMEELASGGHFRNITLTIGGEEGQQLPKQGRREGDGAGLVIAGNWKRHAYRFLEFPGAVFQSGTWVLKPICVPTGEPVTPFLPV